VILSPRLALRGPAMSTRFSCELLTGAPGQILIKKLLHMRSGALTGMRRYLQRHTSARVLLGGKRSGFQGEIPGLMEEALLAVEAEQPIYLAGGFGGVTADIVSALGVDDGSWLPPDADAGPRDLRWEDGYARLAAHAALPHWPGLGNGLDDDENRRLAATHRPSDIAALVSLGLGRLRRDAGPGAGRLRRS
jgi:hypothetical protein